jgi:hypothetical protein
MKTQLIRTLSLAALGSLSFPVTTWAAPAAPRPPIVDRDPFERSSEKLVSKQVDLFIRGIDQRTGVLATLGVREGEAKNLIIIARTGAGFGVIEVLESTTVIASQRVGTSLETIQVPLRGEIGRDIRSLQLRTSGNFHIAFIGLVVDDGRGSQPPEDETRRREREYEFVGVFESTDVSFNGRDREEIFSSCQNFLTRTRLDNIDDLRVFGQRVRVAAFLKRDAACAVAALNAREILRGERRDIRRPGDERPREASYILDASVEGVPVRIEDPTRMVRDERFRADDIGDLRGQMDRLLPLLMRSLSLADDLQVDGQSFRTGGFLDASGVTAVLKGNLKTELGRLQARGSIEGSPIHLFGYEREEIRSGCLEYMRGARSALTNVDDIMINGQSRRGTGFYTNAEVCMIVSTLAR